MEQTTKGYNLRTCRQNLFVTQNEDGTLTMYRGGNKPAENVGMLIKQMGGIPVVLDKAKQYTVKNYEKEVITYADYVEHLIQLCEYRKQQHQKNIRKRAEIEELRGATAEEDMKALLVKYQGKPIETNADNIRTVLYYVRYAHYPELPAMEIGYTCNVYDCDGKTAVAMKLDKPILYDGELVAKFQLGAPRGYLMKYRRI